MSAWDRGWPWLLLVCHGREPESVEQELAHKGWHVLTLTQQATTLQHTTGSALPRCGVAQLDLQLPELHRLPGQR